MNLRVYLDTSVFSAYFDARVRDRQGQTEAFWARRHEFELATSELAREELLQARDTAQRQRLVGLLKGFTVHPVSKDMERLGQRYIDAGVFTSVMRNDAVHVAAAVLTRQGHPPLVELPPLGQSTQTCQSKRGEHLPGSAYD
jgi:hypothetical protein